MNSNRTCTRLFHLNEIIFFLIFSWSIRPILYVLAIRSIENNKGYGDLTTVEVYYFIEIHTVNECN